MEHSWVFFRLHAAVELRKCILMATSTKVWNKACLSDVVYAMDRLLSQAETSEFAAQSQRRLVVYIEETGNREDKEIREYHNNLRIKGMFFDPDNSQKYAPLNANGFAETLFAKPNFITKDHPLAQFADLVVYAIAKGRYDPNYKPYRALWDAGKIIDTALLTSEAPQLGIKYYCFDGL